MQRISRLTCVAALGAALAASAAGRAGGPGSGPAGAAARPRSTVVQVYVPSWKELRQRNVVMQTYDYSCGAAALATISATTGTTPPTNAKSSTRS